MSNLKNSWLISTPNFFVLHPHVYAVSDDTGGDLIEHYRYSAFGEIEIFNELGNRIAGSQINNTITWNTRRLDSLTGFYLYKYRHYSPQLGRWPSRDPIEEQGGMNVYSFCYNSPWSWIDILGREPAPSSGSPTDGLDYWADINSRLKADIEDSRIALDDLLDMDRRVPSRPKPTPKVPNPNPSSPGAKAEDIVDMMHEAASNRVPRFIQAEGERQCGKEAKYQHGNPMANCCCCVIFGWYSVDPANTRKVPGDVLGYLEKKNCDKSRAADSDTGVIRPYPPFERIKDGTAVVVGPLYIPWPCS